VEGNHAQGLSNIMSHSGWESRFTRIISGSIRGAGISPFTGTSSTASRLEQSAVEQSGIVFTSATAETGRRNQTDLPLVGSAHTRMAAAFHQVADGAIARPRARHAHGFFAGTLMSHSTGNVAASSTTTQEVDRFRADLFTPSERKAF